MSDLQSLPDPRHYAYRVLWSPEDDEFVGLCTEFPSLSWLDTDQDQALIGIRGLVADSLKDMAASAETVPQPLSERSYSGKFLVRVSAELHARLAREAAEMKVSLNQLANQRLASHCP
jgi:predicted HicB family RNase H-like nuclease